MVALSSEGATKTSDWNIGVKNLIEVCKDRRIVMEHNDGAKLFYLLTGVSIGAVLVGVFFARHSAKGKSLIMKEAVEAWEDEGGAPRSIPVAASH